MSTATTDSKPKYHLKQARPFMLSFMNDLGRHVELSVIPSNGESFQMFCRTLIWATSNNVELRIRPII